MEKSLDLYTSHYPEKIAKTQYGIKTAAEWGYVPYVMAVDLEEDYKLLRQYEHRCPRCGSSMERMREGEGIDK